MGCNSYHIVETAYISLLVIAASQDTFIQIFITSQNSARSKQYTEEVNMNKPVRLLKHPVHPMLVVFPLGLLATGVIFDLIAMFTGKQNFYGVSYWMIAAGIVGGLLAAIFGFTDWLSIHPNTRAKSVGGWHGLGNLTIVILFAISWWLRSQDPNRVPSTLAFSLSLLGGLMALVTGWLGGELVYRLGMAVEQGANENAPNSLTHDQPLTPRQTPQSERRKQTGGRSGD